MITKDYIQNAYNQVLEEVTQIIPIHQWKYHPTGLGFTQEKSKYGLATPEGKVLISDFFLSTTATTKLDFTLRHEFAHLAVGLSNHHNRLFKHVERRFGVDPNLDLSEELEQIQAKINFKYTVLAHLENGTVHNFGGVHRKTKRYTGYPENSPHSFSVEGVKILRFEFIENARN